MGKRRPTDYRYEDGRRPTWEAIRRHVLLIQPECALCGQPSTEVDHIWPRFYGGDDGQLNLQGLCVPCNRAKGNSVDPHAASTAELTAALGAVTDRAVAALDDVERFLAPLVMSAVTCRHPEAIRALRLVGALLGVVRDEATAHYAMTSEWLAELEESAA